VPADTTALPWGAAMVSRDDRTITVHTGPGYGGCEQFESPRATASFQDGGQVVIAVHARVVTAAECGVNDSVQLTVTLSTALGTRTVRDAATGGTRPVFRERYLPQLPAGQWTPIPHVSWDSTSDSWFRGYNGPQGTEINFTASPRNPVNSLPVVTTVRLGTREGIIAGSELSVWQVIWHADGSSYRLEFVPREGDTMTLAEFRQLLTTLTWS